AGRIIGCRILRHGRGTQCCERSREYGGSKKGSFLVFHDNLSPGGSGNGQSAVPRQGSAQSKSFFAGHIEVRDEDLAGFRIGDEETAVLVAVERTVAGEQAFRRLDAQQWIAQPAELSDRTQAQMADQQVVVFVDR